MSGPAYRPLSEGQHQIRLLALHPAEFREQVVRCRLEYVALNDQHPMHYVALSYCWGGPVIDNRDRSTIIVDGLTVRVRRGLEAALKELRRRNIDQVWADALCINQADDDERISQIRLMPQIYRVASRVIAWLGDGDESRPEHARKLVRSLSAVEISQTDHWHRGSMSVDQIAIDPDQTRVLRRIERRRSHQWDAFRQMLRCDYWTRVWIIQEISFAKKLKLLWGEESFFFRDIVIALTACRSLRKKNDQADRVAEMQISSHIESLFGLRKRVWDMTATSLLQCMLMARRSRSTDPRDRVFALLGLAFDGYRILPAPSYIIDQNIMNIQLTLGLIMSSRSMDVLVFRNERPGDWFRNWFDSRALRDDRVADYLDKKAAFAECPWRKHAVSKWPQRPKIMHQKWAATAGVGARHMYRLIGTQLEVRAHIIDTITNCSATYYERWRDPVFTPNAAIRGGQSRTTKRKLFYLLHDLTCPPSRQKSGDWSEFCRLLLGKRRRDNVYESVGDLMDWLTCAGNQLFTIDGHTLQQWLSEPQPYLSCMEELFGGYSGGHIRVARRILATVELGMRLCVTREGELGWVTRHAKPRDRIALLAGCSVPVVLRRIRGSHRTFQVIGDSIIYGRMKGENIDSQQIIRSWNEIVLR